MSARFECVLSCEFKETMPNSILDKLSAALNGEDIDFIVPYELAEEMEWSSRFLPKPGIPLSDFAGFTEARLEKVHFSGVPWQPVFRWKFQMRRSFIDDQYMEWCYFLFWVAHYAKDGFAGYWRELFDKAPQLLYFKDGLVYTSSTFEEPKLWG